MLLNEFLGAAALIGFVATVGAVELVLLCGWTVERLTGVPRGGFVRRLRIPWSVLSGLLLCAAVWATAVEPGRFEVTRHRVEAPGLPEGFRMRILQLSDLHLEGEGPAAAWAARTVVQEAPDLIALTGDYLNDWERGKEAFGKLLAGLEAPCGMAAVVGNYDGFDPATLRSSVITLRGGAHMVSFGGRKIKVFGSDLTEPPTFARLLQSTAPADYTVVLYHKPEMIELAAGLGADLYLCGHTHGGQIRLPFYGAVITLSSLGKKYECGRYQVGAMTGYVCRGVGCEGGRVPRMRFLCRPEIAVFDVIGTAK